MDIDFWHRRRQNALFSDAKSVTYHFCSVLYTQQRPLQQSEPSYRMPRKRKPETREQRDKRNMRAQSGRMSLNEHFDVLMTVLGIEDRRHKTAPPRHEVLKMAIKRIEEDRAVLHGIKQEK